MTNEELGQLLSKLDKKLDKILTMQTKIAKVLHLLPVTEKEERAIQIQQRENSGISLKVANDLDAMSNKSTDSDESASINLYNDAPMADIYEDVIGHDILG